MNSPADQPETHTRWFAEIWASVASTVILILICCGLYPLLIFGIGQLVFPHQANGSLVNKAGTPATDSDAVGSSLIGQNFTQAYYFQPRPSDAGSGYDPTASSGTNFGPLSDQLLNGSVSNGSASAGVRLRAMHYAVDNHISFNLYSVTLDSAGNPVRTQVPLSKYEDAQGDLDDVALTNAFPHPAPDGSAPTGPMLIAADFSTSIPGDAVTSSGSGLDPHISPANAEIQKTRVAKARGISPAQVDLLIADHIDGAGLGFIGDPGVNVLMLNLALDAKYPVPASPAAPSTQPATQPAGK